MTVDRVARLAEAAGFRVRFDRAELDKQTSFFMYLERDGVAPLEVRFYRPTTLASFHWSGAFHRAHWREGTGPQPVFQTIKALPARFNELADEAQARDTKADVIERVRAAVKTGCDVRNDFESEIGHEGGDPDSGTNYKPFSGDD